MKRLIYYLIINILVSACTTFVVLTVWDRTHSPAAGSVEPVALGVSGEGEAGVSTSGSITPTIEDPTLTPTPTSDPYKDAMAYEVQANDTLGVIAEEYGLTVGELLEYNGLTDANALSVGQVIYIPVTPEAEPTEPPATRTPAAQSSGTPSAPAQPARVEISSVIGPGDLGTERVFLTRKGDGELSLAGWTLEDEGGNTFVFPQLKLYKDGAVNVWTTTGTETVVDLYWGMSRPVWESGETVTLRDAQGEEQDTYRIP